MDGSNPNLSNGNHEVEIKADGIEDSVGFKELTLDILKVKLSIPYDCIAEKYLCYRMNNYPLILQVRAYIHSEICLPYQYFTPNSIACSQQRYLGRFIICVRCALSDICSASSLIK